MTTASRISLRDVAHYPLPGTNAPVSPAFSADGRYVTYLYSPDNTLTRELWCYDRQTGREFRLIEPPGGGDSDRTVSREEALRRERQRQLASGVTSYAWSEEGDTLLVPIQGNLFIKRGVEGELRQVTEGGGCIDPHLDRDGSMVAFVRDGELHSLDLTREGATPTRLTFDAAPAGAFGDRPLTNGLAEFVAQEEMGRAAGFWWSPDGAWLAFEQVDNTPVPLFIIPHPGTEAVDMEAHRYPFAGKANARVRLGVVPARGAEGSGGEASDRRARSEGDEENRTGSPMLSDIQWMPLSPVEDFYLARVDWTPDNLIVAQIQSRDQTRIELRRFDPRGGDGTTLFVDEVRPWVNLTDDLRFVREPGAPSDAYTILWSSERDGARNLYLHDRDGAFLRRLTQGELFIDRVKRVDAAGGWVYVEGWRESPLESHLFRVPLAGGAAEQVTREPGFHLTEIARDARCYVDRASSSQAPPSAAVRGIDAEESFRLQANAPADPRLEDLHLAPPRFVEIAARDGAVLRGAVFMPPDLQPGEKAPVVVSVYGGPHVQYVQDSWGITVAMRAQFLAREGFIVLILDNRGSARRGLAFEGAVHRNMGDLEVRDQVDGVRWLGEHVPEADASRVGVYGWSYGGYMALMCLLRAPEVFGVAVAGAPVTAWDGYDTHYTERYMGTPQDNPDGYRVSSPIAHIEGLRGHLMLVHGMIDENVHFRHTGRLITALIEQGKPYEIQLYPEERHSPRREEDRIFMEGRIAEFFARHL